MIFAAHDYVNNGKVAVPDVVFRAINTLLEAKYGEPIGSGNVCAAYRRWFEVRDLPLPPRRTNCGRPRKAG